MIFFFIRNGLEWESVKPAQQSFNLPTLRQHEKCSNVQVSLLQLRTKVVDRSTVRGNLGCHQRGSSQYLIANLTLTSRVYTIHTAHR
jgi:hypothetical protein